MEGEDRGGAEHIRSTSGYKSWSWVRFPVPLEGEDRRYRTLMNAIGPLPNWQLSMPPVWKATR